MIHLTLPERIYYGENEVNKKAFMKLYKHKSLKLQWIEHAILDGKEVSGWFNHLGIQSVVYHSKRKVKDLFGNEHESFTDACFLTEIEYQNLMK